MVVLSSSSVGTTIILTAFLLALSLSGLLTNNLNKSYLSTKSKRPWRIWLEILSNGSMFDGKTE
jgi:hypothetical protein